MIFEMLVIMRVKFEHNQNVGVFFKWYNYAAYNFHLMLHMFKYATRGFNVIALPKQIGNDRGMVTTMQTFHFYVSSFR